jgi:magnesium transporter
MLNVFTLVQGRLVQKEVDGPEALMQVQPVWVDLEGPSPEEKGWMLGRFGLDIPRPSRWPAWRCCRPP